jgi:hypothetical protein
MLKPKPEVRAPDAAVYRNLSVSTEIFSYRVSEE